jgi:hypothetical protein
VERWSTTSRSKLSTLLGDLQLEYDFVPFQKVDSALECTGSLVIDVSMTSMLLHGASAAQYEEIDSLQYGNSTLEWDHSALEYLNSFPDHLEYSSLSSLLLESDFVVFLKVGSALECIGPSVFDVSIASKLLHTASTAQHAEIESLQYGNSTLEKDNSALESLNSFLEHLETSSLSNLLLECDFVVVLKVGSALEYNGT